MWRGRQLLHVIKRIRQQAYLGEVVIHRFHRLRIVVTKLVPDPGHAPVACGNKIDAVQVRCPGDSFELGVRPELLPVGLETRVELVTGVLDSHTIKVASRGSSCRGCIGNLVCRCIGSIDGF